MRPMRPAAAMPDDDLPIFEEAPLRAFELAPRAIRPWSRRGPLIAGAWAAGLALIVGVGILAGGSAAEPGVSRDDDVNAQYGFDAQRGFPTQKYPEAHWPPGRVALAVTDVVTLESPAPARVEVTTHRVAVAGSVLVRAARVEISLEARGNRVLDHVSVDVTDPHGGIRPESAPTFSASFELPYPRPNGTMWIVVTAYDTDGMPLGGTRRPFAVGPLLEPEIQAGAPADAAVPGIGATEVVPLPDQRTPQTGELPTCLPQSRTRSSTC